MKRNQIYVGGLPHCSSKKTVVLLTNYFSRYGEVHDIHFPHKQKGFVFIEFSNENTPVRVCENKNHTINGKMVSLQRIQYSGWSIEDHFIFRIS